MAAETGLWDDSALITAFDKAMSKYKEMHKGYQADQSGEDEVSVMDNQEEVVSDEPVRDANVSGSQEETDLARNLDVQSHSVEALASEESQLKLEAHIQDGDSRTLAVEESDANGPPQLTDYNQLLSQYYAIEEQRQKILQQLYSANTENNLSTSYMPSNTSQYPYYPNQYSSCLACCCACSGATYSVPPCNFGGQCLPGDPSTAPSHSQVNILGSVVEAAGEVLPPPTNSADISNTGAENVKESLHVSMGNDNGFSDVLNAWYTAGFYTAMYLNGKSAKDMGR